VINKYKSLGCFRRLWRHTGTRESCFPIYFLIYCTHSPPSPWRFTLPCLNGSSPLHSFVTPFQGMEAGFAFVMGLCPLFLSTRYTVFSYISCERANKRNSNQKINHLLSSGASSFVYATCLTAAAVSAQKFSLRCVIPTKIRASFPMSLNME
jgi:hypothetical protein